MVPPLSGYFIVANDNYPVAANDNYFGSDEGRVAA